MSVMTRSPVSILKVMWGIVILLSPMLLRGEQLGEEALSSFPADTQQVAYSNLEQLRLSPDYPQIRERVLNRQLRYFQDFLRMSGIDLDKDVDEVILGWRGAAEDSASFFGMAAGRFQPEKIYQYYRKYQIPSRHYETADLYPLGSGDDPGDLFLTFLDPSLAAFGRLPDLKAILDVRQGTVSSLETNAAFADWEAELEDTAPQWGILTGKVVANLAAQWVSGGKGSIAPPADLLGVVQAALYRVEWDGGFDSHLALLCRDTQSASALGALSTLLPAAGGTETSGTGAEGRVVVQNPTVHVNGTRVEIDASGPVEALDQILQLNP
jgi:hypothetical protein